MTHEDFTPRQGIQATTGQPGRRLSLVRAHGLEGGAEADASEQGMEGWFRDGPGADLKLCWTWVQALAHQ